MRHPNAERLQAHLDTLAHGDIEQAMSFYSDDVVFHYPGSNPLSGDHRGKNQVLALRRKVMELTDGSFRPDVHDILASDDHVAALVTVHARPGRSNGRVAERGPPSGGSGCLCGSPGRGRRGIPGRDARLTAIRTPRIGRSRGRQ